MQTMLLALSILVVANSSLMSLGDNCLEQYIPDLNKICIRPNYIQGCATYKNTHQCAACSTDYELHQSKCLLTSSSDLNTNGLMGCLIDNGNTCSNCANGYLRVDGLCQKGVRYCSQYDSQNQCVQCQNEYSLIFGHCKHNLMLGCKFEQADHTCLECYKPFELDNYKCVIPNCKNYNDYGCYSCECGFFITESRSCQPMQPGCLKYFRGICVECMSNYKLKGGICQIEGCLEQRDHLCINCKSNYNLVNGICQFQNCSEWKDNNCLICSQDHSLVAGKCVPNLDKYICSG